MNIFLSSCQSLLFFYINFSLTILLLVLCINCIMWFVDITDVDSSEFQSKESAVCLELSRRLWSMTACYVQNILACESVSSVV